MRIRMSYFIFAWLFALQCAGLFLFSSGFFLTRLELHDVSPCNPTPLLEGINATALWAGSSKEGGGGGWSEDAGCWTPRAYDRAVVVLIDGLRHDFLDPFAHAQPTEATTPSDAAFSKHGDSEQGSEQDTARATTKTTTFPPPPPPTTTTTTTTFSPQVSSPPRRRVPHYAGKFAGSVGTLLVKEPTATALVRFEADPPTVTAQRLKALTTGSLPTFFDASKNFDSAKVAEDSWVGQAHAQWVQVQGVNAADTAAAAAAAAAARVVSTVDMRQPSPLLLETPQPQKKRRRMVFMGDDTWESLFPSKASENAQQEDNPTERGKDGLGNDGPGNAVPLPPPPLPSSSSLFSPSHGMPSFDTRDLHSVDSAVAKLLAPAIRALATTTTTPIDQETSQQQFDKEGSKYEASENTVCPGTGERGRGREEGEEGGGEERLNETNHHHCEQATETCAKEAKKGAAALSAHSTTTTTSSTATTTSRGGLVVAHVLGVDHVGHTYQANHEAMGRKLGYDMNSLVESVVEAVRWTPPPTSSSSHPQSSPSQSSSPHFSSPSKPFSPDSVPSPQQQEASPPLRTLVLVFGDHGMTEDGNHGGASEEEVMAGFFAWVHTSGGALTSEALGTGSSGRKEDPASGASPPPFHSGPFEHGNQAKSKGPSHLADQDIFTWLATASWSDTTGFTSAAPPQDSTTARPPQERACSGSDDKKDDEQVHQRVHQERHGQHQQRRVIAQVDLVPTLSLLLGLPVPFASVGGVMPELFTLLSEGDLLTERRVQGDDSTPSKAEKCSKWSSHPLTQALLVNSAQLWAYLGAYDRAVSLPPTELSRLSLLLHTALDYHRELLEHEKGGLHDNSDCESSCKGKLGSNDAGDDPKKQPSRTESTKLHGNVLTDESFLKAQRVWVAYRLFLSECLELSRRLFTRFDGTLMALGLIVAAAGTAAAAGLFVFLIQKQTQRRSESNRGPLLTESAHNANYDDSSQPDLFEAVASSVRWGLLLGMVLAAPVSLLFPELCGGGSLPLGAALTTSASTLSFAFVTVWPSLLSWWVRPWGSLRDEQEEQKVRRNGTESFRGLFFAFGCSLLFSATRFSNSFIESEESVVVFLSNSAVAATVFDLIPFCLNHQPRHHHRSSVSSLPSCPVLVLLVAAGVVVAIVRGGLPEGWCHLPLGVGFDALLLSFFELASIDIQTPAMAYFQRHLGIVSLPIAAFVVKVCFPCIFFIVASVFIATRFLVATNLRSSIRDTFAQPTASTVSSAREQLRSIRFKKDHQQQQQQQQQLRVDLVLCVISWALIAIFWSCELAHVASSSNLSTVESIATAETSGGEHKNSGVSNDFSSVFWLVLPGAARLVVARAVYVIAAVQLVYFSYTSKNFHENHTNLKAKSSPAEIKSNASPLFKKSQEARTTKNSQQFRDISSGDVATQDVGAEEEEIELLIVRLVRFGRFGVLGLLPLVTLTLGPAALVPCAAMAIHGALTIGAAAALGATAARGGGEKDLLLQKGNMQREGRTVATPTPTTTTTDKELVGRGETQPNIQGKPRPMIERKKKREEEGGSSSSSSSSSSNQRLVAVGAVVAGACRLAGRHHFFATGHSSCDVASVQYGAAFVGFDGFHLAAAVALVTLNTIGAELLWAVAVLPLAAAAALIAHDEVVKAAALAEAAVVCPQVAAKAAEVEAAEVEATAAKTSIPAAPTEHRSQKKPEQLSRRLDISNSAIRQPNAPSVPLSPPLQQHSPCNNGFIGVVMGCWWFGAGLDFFCSLACVAVHRRHLMAWRVFAPKLLLGSASHLACAAGFVVMCSFCAF